MFKSLIATVLMFASAVAFAAVDINKASQAELEAVKGIGPAMSTRMLDARKKQPFADWRDVQGRVKGVGPGNAAKFSADGLTVNGVAYTAAMAEAPAGKAGKSAPAPVKKPEPTPAKATKPVTAEKK